MLIVAINEMSYMFEEAQKVPLSKEIADEEQDNYYEFLRHGRRLNEEKGHKFLFSGNSRSVLSLLNNHFATHRERFKLGCYIYRPFLLSREFSLLRDSDHLIIRGKPFRNDTQARSFSG
ncbi:MAG: hypothetical protein NC124_10745 [Clostridium sp.]|nr:hypothetical protein [Clostridium sp.]